MIRRKVAVVLFNLGGPDGPADVRPFLQNLFSDPAIIGAPAIVRLPLAALIARTRTRSAQANYAIMGGGSPLLVETRGQAVALGQALSRALPGDEVRLFIAMRYWNPTTREAADQVARFAPDEIVLAPLYPQYSTATTGSSLAAWRKAYDGPGQSRAICCWHDQAGLIEAHVQRIEETWLAAGRPKVRLLFSAHGLPESLVAGVYRDVDSAYAQFESVRTLLRPYKQKYLEESKDVRDLISFSFANGGASLLEFLDAQKSYRDTQLSYRNLVGSYLSSLAQLSLAVGQEVTP